MALQSIIQDQNDKFTAAFSSIASSINRSSPLKNYPSSYRQPLRPSYDPIPWKHQPPTDLGEVRLYNNREWRWCPKCHHRKGQWVTSHHPSKHDEFHRASSPSPSNLRSKTLPPYQVLPIFSLPSIPKSQTDTIPCPGSRQRLLLIPDDTVNYAATFSSDEEDFPTEP